MEKKQKPQQKYFLLTWTDLKQSDMEQLEKASVAQARAVLRVALKLDSRFSTESKLLDKEAAARAAASSARRQEVLLDLCCNLLAFARQQKFTPQKTSTFVSLVLSTHSACCDREGPPPTLERGYALFEELLLKHSVERPPFSVAVFAYPEVKAINDYVINSYFRHYSLYQHVFATTRELDLQPVYSAAQSVAAQVPVDVIPPLSQATLVEPLDVKPAARADAAPAAAAADSRADAGASAAVGSRGLDAADSAPAAAAGSPAAGALSPDVERVLRAELDRMQSEMDAKLKAQHDKFNKRLSELEQTAGKTTARKSAAASS